LIQKPKPQTLKELQSWLGVTNYYRRFIKHYATIAQPLYDLMGLSEVPKQFRKRNGAVDGNKVLITWTEEAEKSFDKLKNFLCSHLVLALPDFEKPMIMSTDACEYGYGAVLEQSCQDALRPLAYFSKSYTVTQRKYATSEKELLAVVMAVEHFHQYLYGKQLTVYTDHLPLTWLLNKKNPHHRLERWLLRLSLYNLVIAYKPGKENVIADFLSRLPEEDLVDNNKDDDYHDILVAVTEEADTGNESCDSDTGSEYSNNESETEIEQSMNTEDDSINNASVIAREPNSSFHEKYTSLVQEQAKDTDLKWIKEFILKCGDSKPQNIKFDNRMQQIIFKQYDNLRIIEGILYRMTEDINGYSITQLVLPKQIVQDVIKQIHTSIYHAHLGRRKTLSKITSRFYRPFIKKDVKNFIKECDSCQKIKEYIHKHNANLLFLTPSRPNQLVTTDFAGPFKVTVRGNVHIIIICHFTSFLQLYGIQNTQATTAANKIVEEWICRFGIMDQILSDGGKSYQSKLLEAIYEFLDIEKLKTTPFHPQCDGKSENVIKTVKEMITAYIDEDQEDWDLNLNKIAFAYNTSVHAMTGQTPFEMMFGRRPKIPIDLLIPNTNDLGREAILEEYKITNELGEITVVEDVQQTVTEQMPIVAQSYLNE
jgi:hypothetical protein